MWDNDQYHKFIGLLRSYLPLAGADSLDPSANLTELGLDSLNTVEILVRLEDEFGVGLPDEELTPQTFATVGSLWSALTRYAPAPATDPTFAHELR